jgi:hypothetical protein
VGDRSHLLRADGGAAVAAAARWHQRIGLHPPGSRAYLRFHAASHCRHCLLLLLCLLTPLFSHRLLLSPPPPPLVGLLLLRVLQALQQEAQEGEQERRRYRCQHPPKPHRQEELHHHQEQQRQQRLRRRLRPRASSAYCRQYPDRPSVTLPSRCCTNTGSLSRSVVIIYIHNVHNV